MVRYHYRMDMRAVLERIEGRLEALELSANRASELAGKPDAIRNLKRAVGNGGRQGNTVTTLAALAPVLKCSLAYLVDGSNPPNAEGVGEAGPKPINEPALENSLREIFRILLAAARPDVAPAAHSAVAKRLSASVLASTELRASPSGEAPDLRRVRAEANRLVRAALTRIVVPNQKSHNARTSATH